MPLHKIQEWLHESDSGIQFAEMLPVFKNELPDDVEFDSNVWNLIAWVRRRGNRKSANISFEKYQNAELKLLVKTFILYKRETRRVDQGLTDLVTRSLLALDQALGPTRSALKLNNEDFAEAQTWLEENFEKGGASRMANAMQGFGAWLSTFLGFRVTYKTSLKSHHYHGRKANQDGRDQKLLPTDVIRDLMAAASRDDLILKDRFFLSALCLNVCCGFRINEMSTLPVNCMFEEEGQTGIRYYPEKTGKLGVRWVPGSMVPTVKKAIQFITDVTESGREFARSLTISESVYNWREIIADQEAFRYFVAKFAHVWTSKPEHNMLNKSGAWFEMRKTYIDVIYLLELHGGNKAAAARELGVLRGTFKNLLRAQLAVLEGKLPPSARSRNARTSWDKDSRVIAMDRMIKATIGVTLNENKRKWLRDIIEDAQNCQLSGKVYPAPDPRPDWESKYRMVGHPPLIVDKDGTAVLEAEDALFVLRKYSLAIERSTKSSEISYVDDKQFTRWLNGEKRSHGTKNHEDSCFSRLGIMDPRTNEIASFVWHDIRHWLNTMYQKGGLSEDMIALIFGRKSSSNHVYDQTDMDTRVSRLQDSVRKGQVFGHLATTYSRLAEHSREEAEQYLAARTIMVNLMPHGMCTNNWSAMPCPHHLGCFAGNHEKSDSVCQHLEVEPEDTRSIEEIKRINREAAIAVEVIPVQSPQHAHFVRVEKNTHDLLEALAGAQGAN